MPGPKTPQTLPGSIHRLLKPQHSAFRAVPASVHKLLKPQHFPFTAFKVPFPRPQNPSKPFPAVSTSSTSYSSHSILLLGRSRVPFARPQNLPNPSRQYPQATQATAFCFVRHSRVPFARLQNPANPFRQYPQATQATALCLFCF